jgi:hypothetical protein
MENAYLTFDPAAGSKSRPLICALRIRFSVASYSLRSSNSWSTVPVMYARIRTQSICPLPRRRAYRRGQEFSRRGRRVTARETIRQARKLQQLKEFEYFDRTTIQRPNLARLRGFAPDFYHF